MPRYGRKCRRVKVEGKATLARPARPRVCPACPSLDCPSGLRAEYALASVLGAGAWWATEKVGWILYNRWRPNGNDGRRRAPPRRGGGVVA